MTTHPSPPWQSQVSTDTFQSTDAHPFPSDAHDGDVLAFTDAGWVRATPALIEDAVTIRVTTPFRGVLCEGPGSHQSHATAMAWIDTGILPDEEDK